VETETDSVKFSVDGEVGKGSVILKETDAEKPEDQTSVKVEEKVKLSFALRYLNMFNKASSCSPIVNLSMSGDTPLVVEYRIEKLGALKFYLAPKISDEA
jgi:proliferating cell nuclear antigen